jgi:hypothetical protein
MQSGDNVEVDGPISFGTVFLYAIFLSPIICVMLFIVMGVILMAFPQDLQARATDVIAKLLIGCAFGFPFIIARYIPSRQKVLIDGGLNTLQIKRGKTISGEYDLNGIKCFVVKKFYFPSPGSRQFKLLIERTDGSVSELLSDDNALPYGQRWKSFVRRIAEVSHKPIKEEAYMERYDGTVVPYVETRSLKRYLFLIIPSIVSIFWAILLGIYPTLRNFLFLGALAVLTNITIILMYQKIKGDSMLRDLENKLTMGGMLFSMVISFAVSYTLFSVLINGLDFLSKR